MGITVRTDFYFMVRKAVGLPRTEIEIENSTLKGLLDELSIKFGKKFEELLLDPENNEVNPDYKILINGRSYQILPDLLDTRLKNGDVVSIFSPVGGG